MNPNTEYATKQDIINSEARMPQWLQQLAQVQLNTSDHLQTLAVSTEGIARSLQQLADRLDQLGQRVDQLTESVSQLKESEKHTDDRLNALIAVVDDLVRRNPRQ
jgi:uncharacterized phage infection (PIP) family protein YhgE